MIIMDCLHIKTMNKKIYFKPISVCVFIFVYFIVLFPRFALAGDVNVSYIDVSDGLGKLYINENIELEDGNTLIMFVKGNVVINRAVKTLKSVFIFATESITTDEAATAAEAQDKATTPLYVFGGLYAKEINFWRDLKDSGSIVGGGAYDFSYSPATSVLYDPSIIVKANTAGGVPPEIGASNVYWVLKE